MTVNFRFKTLLFLVSYVTPKFLPESIESQTAVCSLLHDGVVNQTHDAMYSEEEDVVDEFVDEKEIPNLPPFATPFILVSMWYLVTMCGFLALGKF